MQTVPSFPGSHNARNLPAIEKPTLRIYRFYEIYEQAYSQESFTNPRTGDDEIRVRKIPGEMKSVHMVEYGPLGSDKIVITDKVDRLAKVNFNADPDENPAELFALLRWAQIAPAYENWKRGIEPSENGTPLAAWPGLSAEQAQVLRMKGIQTVQELATLTDRHFEQFGIPGLRALRDNANRFIAALENTHVEDALAEKDRQIADLTETVSEMKEMLRELMAERKAGRGSQEPDASAFDPPEGFVDPRADEDEPTTAPTRRKRNAA